MTNLSSKTLRAAADIQDKVEKLLKELSSILDGTEIGNGIVKRKYTKRAGGDVDRFKAARADKPKRKMSAAGRAKIAAAAKARWAKVKAAGKNSL
jgi:hypothetical protein